MAAQQKIGVCFHRTMRPLKLALWLTGTSCFSSSPTLRDWWVLGKERILLWCWSCGIGFHAQSPQYLWHGYPNSLAAFWWIFDSIQQLSVLKSPRKHLFVVVKRRQKNLWYIATSRFTVTSTSRQTAQKPLVKHSNWAIDGQISMGSHRRLQFEESPRGKQLGCKNLKRSKKSSQNKHKQNETNISKRYQTIKWFGLGICCSWQHEHTISKWTVKTDKTINLAFWIPSFQTLGAVRVMAPSKMSGRSKASTDPSRKTRLLGEIVAKCGPQMLETILLWLISMKKQVDPEKGHLSTLLIFSLELELGSTLWYTVNEFICFKIDPSAVQLYISPPAFSRNACNWTLSEEKLSIISL